MTSGWFCLESSLLTLAISASAFSFYKDRTMVKAKRMFHASLLYLPVFMSGLLFHRLCDDQQGLAASKAVAPGSENDNQKSRERHASAGTQSEDLWHML